MAQSANSFKHLSGASNAGAGGLFLVLAIVLAVIAGGTLALLDQGALAVNTGLVVALIVVIIWALPTTLRAPTQLTASLFIMYSISLFVWPSYIALRLPSLPLVGPARLLQFMFLAMLGYSLSISAEFRERFFRPLRHDNLMRWLLLALVVFQFQSIIWGSFINSALIGQLLTRLLLAQISLIIPLLYAASLYSEQPQKLRILFRALAVAIILLTIIAYFESKVQHVLTLDFFPPEFFDADSYQKATTHAGAFRDGVYRSASIFTLPLTFAEFMALASSAPLYLMLERESVRIRFIGFMLYITAFFGVLLSASRLGVVGFAVVGLVYAILWVFRQALVRKGKFLGPAMVMLIPLAAATAATVFLSSHRLQLVALGTGSTTYSDRARIKQLVLGIGKIFEAPFGHGWDTSGIVLSYGSNTVGATIDNFWLGVALDIGIIGLAVMLALFLVAIYRTSQIYMKTEGEAAQLAAPITASLSAFMVIKLVLSAGENHPLVFILLGAAYGLSYRLGGQNLSQGRPIITTTGFRRA